MINAIQVSAPLGIVSFLLFRDVISGCLQANTTKEVDVRIAIRRARNVAGPTNGSVCLALARCYCRDRGN